MRRFRPGAVLAPEERRRRDGLGLLPRARGPEERRQRQRANVLLGLLLVGVGGGILGGSLALFRGSVWSGLLGLLFGGIVLAQGIWLVGRRDRRRHSPAAAGAAGAPFGLEDRRRAG